MDENRYINEVIHEFTSYEIPIPTDEVDVPTVTCDSPEHEHDTRLREGNRVFIVISKQDDDWEVLDVVCWCCSVRPVFQRVTDSAPVAVVEGTLQETPSHVDQTDVCLKSPEVWELTTPHA